MPELMRGQVGRQSGLREIKLEEPLERTCSEASAELVQEDGGAGRLVGRQRATLFEVGAEGALRGIPEGAEAFLLALAAYFHDAGERVDVAEVQPQRFADAEPAGVDHLQDRCIPGGGKRSGFGRFRESALSVQSIGHWL